MKKENVAPQAIQTDKLAHLPAKKPGSLRPMRSMVSLKSFRPKTVVAEMTVKTKMSDLGNEKEFHS